MADPANSSRILTVPNVISIVRLLCVPLFLWLLFGRENRAAAAWLLAALGATDWVDGYIARHFNQVSDLGKILDPTADRILLIVGGGAVFLDGAIPPVIAVPVLIREAVVSAVVIVLAVMGAKRIDVQWVGKAGTLALMVAFPFFLASKSTLGWRDTGEVLAWLFAVPGVVLSYVAAATYLPMARAALAERRVGSAS